MPGDKNTKPETENEQSEPEASLPGRYENRGLIGKGGMGIVYLAYDLQMGREVAIKVLALNNEAKVEERFIREAKTLATLNHPNIVKLLNWGVNDKSELYLTMEYLPGTALSSEIGNGKRLHPSEFREVFTAVLSGLAHAHSKGVIHRDLKPNNILLCNDGKIFPKIIDFGIARSYDQDAEPAQMLTQTGLLMGSPAYMSPEQCKGRKVDQRSDIYSLGCVMYEALTGYPPHKGESAMELMYKHSEIEHESLEKIADTNSTRNLGNLIDRCLSKDPAARPQSADEVLAELANIFKDPIETGKIFGPKEEKRKGFNASISIGLGIALLTAILLIIKLQAPDDTKSLKADKFMAKDHQTRLDQAKADLEDKLLELQHEKQTVELTHKADNLRSKFIQFSEMQRERGEPKEAEVSLDHAAELTPLASKDRPEWQLFQKMDIFQRKAECSLDERNIEKAKQEISQTSSFFNGGARFQATLARTRGRIAVLSHNFVEAKAEFKLMSKTLKDDETNREANRGLKSFPMEMMGFDHDTYSRKKILEFWKIVKGEQFTDPQEKLGAVDLMAEICDALMPEDSNKCGDILIRMKELLAKIPADTPGFAALSSKVSKLDDKKKNAHQETVKTIIKE